MVSNMIRMHQAATYALTRYQPKSLDIPLTLIKAQNSDASSMNNNMPEDLGWGELTSNKVKTVITTGTHISMITEPEVSDLADKINLILNV